MNSLVCKGKFIIFQPVIKDLWIYDWTVTGWSYHEITISLTAAPPKIIILQQMAAVTMKSKIEMFTAAIELVN